MWAANRLFENFSDALLDLLMCPVHHTLCWKLQLKLSIVKLSIQSRRVQALSPSLLFKFLILKPHSQVTCASSIHQSFLYQSSLYQSSLHQSFLYQISLYTKALYTKAPLYQSSLYQSFLYQSSTQAPYTKALYTHAIFNTPLSLPPFSSPAHLTHTLMVPSSSLY